MAYPKINHYLVIHRITREKYYVKNFVTEEEWEVSKFYVKFLKSLDGKTNPYEVFSKQLSDNEIDKILEEMEGEGFFDNDEGATSLGIGSVILPLWKPNVTKVHRIIGALWNKILMFDRKYKRLLRNRGINGKATIAACYILVLMQVFIAYYSNYERNKHS